MPEISAFIPADFNDRKVLFIDVKPFKEALYPKTGSWAVDCKQFCFEFQSRVYFWETKEY